MLASNISLHDLVTIALIYLAIGGCIWMVLESSGLVHAKLRDWEARGRRLSAFSFVLAMGFVIVAWPKFVIAFVVSCKRSMR